MSKKKLMKYKADIIFEVKGLLGESISFNLTPLTRGKAFEVYHNVVFNLFSVVGGAFDIHRNDGKIGNSIAELKNQISSEEIWELARTLFNGAIINDDEIEDFDEIDVFDDEPHLLYLAIFKAIEGNWPKLFLSLKGKMGGLDSFLKAMKKRAMGAMEAAAEEAAEE